MKFVLMKTTEKESLYNDIDKMTTAELLYNINNEDKKVALAVEKCIPQIEKVADAVADKMLAGGRLFYIGAGTSGRLGIVDASECPPTFGVSHSLVVGLISGGDKAIRKAVEFAEDDTAQAWKDLKEHKISENDFVIGIAASGTTPYVVGGLEKCNENNVNNACIVCNENSVLAKTAQMAIECVVGPEFVTGSTRMKAGTAQKLILNMISTSIMVKLGRIEGNKMVNMQLSNDKLVARGIKMVQDATKCSFETAEKTLKQTNSVKKAIERIRNYK
ncbi:MAG: N-acetylmuramic acid 6-phosphate etherase [Chitinophagales bacterium]|nr:N-acetylmuramic acid 6-phosphate etherase [Chitinophagales bacterium]